MSFSFAVARGPGILREEVEAFLALGHGEVMGIDDVRAFLERDARPGAHDDVPGERDRAERAVTVDRDRLVPGPDDHVVVDVHGREREVDPVIG